jgi:toxin-antitoxin system PIN domain toxin
VIAVDTNILVYAHREDSEWHAVALENLRALAEGKAAWTIPWPCIHEFLAIVTHPRIFFPPSPLSAAVAQVDAWLESPSIRPLAEAVDYWPHLRAAITAAKIVGPQVHDARIAALCAQHGVRELWSADRDFSRFPSLTVVNPVVAE